MNRQIAAAFAACTLLGLAVLAGCGIKGPPLAPLKAGNTLASPEDLAYTLAGDTLTLSWTHTVDPETAKVSPEGFKVFLAVKSLEGCEGCPFIFKEVGVVPMPGMQFQYTLKKDVLHYFRVQAMGENDKVSPFSKTLYIDPETDQ